jgi:hypothetical protein
MPRRLAGKFSATARHRENARRRDRQARAPALHPHCVVVQEHHRHDRQFQPVRDCQPVMTVHHAEGVLLRRDRNSPGPCAENLRLQLRYPVGIDLFGRNQACWRKEANLHIDQPDLLAGTVHEAPSGALLRWRRYTATRRAEGLQARRTFTTNCYQRIQRRVNARTNALTPPPMTGPSRASMKPHRTVKCSDYMSTLIDSRYVRGAPRKNVPNEATLDQ